MTQPMAMVFDATDALITLWSGALDPNVCPVYDGPPIGNNEDNAYVVVGMQALQDYLGADISQLMSGGQQMWVNMGALMGANMKEETFTLYAIVIVTTGEANEQNVASGTNPVYRALRSTLRDVINSMGAALRTTNGNRLGAAAVVFSSMSVTGIQYRREATGTSVQAQISVNVTARL